MNEFYVVVNILYQVLFNFFSFFSIIMIIITILCYSKFNFKNFFRAFFFFAQKLLQVGFSSFFISGTDSLYIYEVCASSQVHRSIVSGESSNKSFGIRPTAEKCKLHMSKSHEGGELTFNTVQFFFFLVKSLLFWFERINI